MTDTIRIPCNWTAAATSPQLDIAITPDIARQIFAMIVPEDMHRLCLELDKSKFMARLEALEQINRDNFAQLAAMREKIRADNPAVAETFDRLLPLTPKPIDAGQLVIDARGKTIHELAKEIKQAFADPAPVDAGPAVPPADDAGVAALVDAWRVWLANNVDMSLESKARCAIYAIRRGDVPGLCDPRHVSGLYDEAQKQIAALRAEVERWHSASDAFEKASEVAAADASKAESKGKLLEATVERLRKAHEDRRDELGKKEARIGTLTTERDQLKAEVERLTRERDGWRNSDSLELVDHQKTKARVAELEAKLANSRKWGSEQEDAKSRFAAELAQTNDAIRIVQGDQIDLRRQRDEARAELAEVVALMRRMQYELRSRVGATPNPVWQELANDIDAVLGKVGV
jgi:DNA repair exonuclease SbcCD ATPase subunit